jgi:LacI family transcriptional regulator
VPDPALALPGDFDQKTAHDMGLRLLAMPQRPTAIVTISNMMTMGLLFGIREQGLKVPGDLSVVGIDDLEFAQLLDPKPTAVTTPILAMARRSIQKLLSQLSGESKPDGEWEVYQPELVVRQSTAKPKG